MNELIHDDCLNYLPKIKSESIDLILADPPFEITRNKWDLIIPIEALWKELKRVIKPSGAIIINSFGLFSAKMIVAAEDIYRYSYVWHKNLKTGFLNANKQPLRSHEDILVFYKNLPVYNPQKTTGHKASNKFTKKTPDGSNYGKTKLVTGGGSTSRYPTTVISIPVIKNGDPNKSHPTQKPVELGEFFIKTYTNPGALVLDFSCGSGTYLEAAKNLGRNYIGIEKDLKYFDISKKRLEKI